MLLTGSRGFRWAISIPIRGKLSFPKIFLSCPEVIKNGVSSVIHHGLIDNVNCIVMVNPFSIILESSFLLGLFSNVGF